MGHPKLKQKIVRSTTEAGQLSCPATAVTGSTAHKREVFPTPGADVRELS